MLQNAEIFVLALSRIGGLFVFAPVLSAAVIPVRVRAMLAVALTAAVLPLLSVQGVARSPGDTLTLLCSVTAETLIGVAVGLIAMLPIAAVELGGLIMGQQVGLGLSSIYNPAIDAESTVFGQLLMYIALAVFISAGGFDAMFGALLRSFEGVPIGAALGVRPPLALVQGMVTSGFDLALRVGAPVLAIVMLETVATGVISRTMPQLNILSIGFAVKIVLGLLAFILGARAIGDAVSDHVHEARDSLLQWSNSLGEPQPTAPPLAVQ